MVPIPLVAITVDGYRRDAVVPAPRRVILKSNVFQIVYIVVDPEILTPEITVDEDAHPRSAKYADRADFVIEAGRHRGPALTEFQAEVVSPEFRVSIEACPGFRWMWSAPLWLAKRR